MGAACPFVNCAVKKKGLEFCWDCPDFQYCQKQISHTEYAQLHDTFTCYQKIRDNITSIRKNGIEAFEEEQRTRESLLRQMLADFNNGRLKTLYCIAATVLEVGELREVLYEAAQKATGMKLAEKAELMQFLLNEVAQKRGYTLKLRK
jgi:hypothetical protein